MAGREEDRYTCSFCGKSAGQVMKLFAGKARGTYICDECVEACKDLLDEELQGSFSGDDINLLKPKEIKERLDQYFKQ